MAAASVRLRVGSYGRSAMTSGGCEAIEHGTVLRHQIDYQAARRQIEALTDTPPSVRARALASYVALFDLADHNGMIAVTTQEIADALATTRPSWNQYGPVLIAAGLLDMHTVHVPARGGARRRLQLLAPAPL